MILNKSLRPSLLSSTAVFSESWAAECLAYGFDVVATDPAPNAEQSLGSYIDAAWPALTVKGLETNVSREKLKFSHDLKETVRADFVYENGPEWPDFKKNLLTAMDVDTRTDSVISSSSSKNRLFVQANLSAIPFAEIRPISEGRINS